MSSTLIISSPSISLLPTEATSFVIPYTLLNLDYEYVTYTISAHSEFAGVYASFYNVQPWGADIYMDKPIITGSLQVPKKFYSDINLDIYNGTQSTITLSVYIGISDRPYGSLCSENGADQRACKIYATPRSALRSTVGGSLLTSDVVPESVYTLSGFTPIATINASRYRSLGNIAPTTLSNTINIPAVTTEQIITLASQVVGSYSPTVFIADVLTNSNCRVKIGCVRLDITPPTVSCSIDRGILIYSLQVTSASSAAGTVSITIFGQTVSVSASATTTKQQQAAVLASLVNNNFATLRATASTFSDIVYIRSLFGQTSATPTVSGITVTVTTVLNNSSHTPLSSTIVSQYQRPPDDGVYAYRFYINDGMLMCFRAAKGTSRMYDCCGYLIDDRLRRVADGDFLVYNDATSSPTSAQSLISTNLYGLLSDQSMMEYYKTSISQVSWTAGIIGAYQNLSATTRVIINTITIQLAATSPFLVEIIEDCVIPDNTGTVSFLGNNIAYIPGTLGNPVGGTVIRSFMVRTQVNTIDINLSLAPFTTYAIVLAADPIDAAKSGSVGIITDLSSLVL